MAVLEPRNFLQPCLLLLLREQADHGYELVSRLRPMHDEGDAGGVYRALRGMERQGLVRSEWQVSDVGPARRTYHVTLDGLSCLDEQVRELEHIHDVLHLFLDRYSRAVAADRMQTAEGVTDDPRADRADSGARSNGVRQTHRPHRHIGS